MDDFVIQLDYAGSFVVCSDTKEHGYVSLLQYLENHGYNIEGLKKTAEGNSHDENRQDYYTIIGSDGPFTELFENVSKQQSSLYVDSPIIERIDVLTDEYISRWSLPFAGYSGEEDRRYVYVQKAEQPYIYAVERVFPKPVENMPHEHERIWAWNTLGMTFLKATRVPYKC